MVRNRWPIHSFLIGEHWNKKQVRGTEVRQSRKIFMLIDAQKLSTRETQGEKFLCFFFFSFHILRVSSFLEKGNLVISKHWMELNLPDIWGEGVRVLSLRFNLEDSIHIVKWHSSRVFFHASTVQKRMAKKLVRKTLETNKQQTSCISFHTSKLPTVFEY